MNITAITKREAITNNEKLNRIAAQFNELVKELNRRNLPENTVSSINRDIEELNSDRIAGHDLKRLILRKQAKICRLIEKRHKIVPKNYYRNLWLVLGMTAFGLPIGITFGMLMNNMGLLAIGLPIGMGIGIAAGSGMDKKAREEGRQLNIELKGEL